MEYLQNAWDLFSADWNLTNSIIGSFAGLIAIFLFVWGIIFGAKRLIWPKSKSGDIGSLHNSKSANTSVNVITNQFHKEVSGDNPNFGVQFGGSDDRK